MVDTILTILGIALIVWTVVAVLGTFKHSTDSDVEYEIFNNKLCIAYAVIGIIFLIVGIVFFWD